MRVYICVCLSVLFHVGLFVCLPFSHICLFVFVNSLYLVCLINLLSVYIYTCLFYGVFFVSVSWSVCIASPFFCFLFVHVFISPLFCCAFVSSPHACLSLSFASRCLYLIHFPSRMCDDISPIFCVLFLFNFLWFAFLFCCCCFRCIYKFFSFLLVRLYILVFSCLFFLSSFIIPLSILPHVNLPFF